MILKQITLSGIAGFTQVSSAQLMGTIPLKIKREGKLFNQIPPLAAWTPGVLESKFLPQYGLVIFQENINPGEKVYVLYKKY